MVIFHIKHYLTHDGIKYFNDSWFPMIKSISSQQQGFISIVHDADRDSSDCVNIILMFADENSVDIWAEQPGHDDLIDALDSYRSRNYWEVATSKHESTEYSKLEWQEIPAAICKA